MITVAFDQSDVNGAPKDVLESTGDGVLYAAIAVLKRTPGAGASGSAQLQLDWTNSDGEPRSYVFSSVLVGLAGDGQTTLIFNLENPSTLTATLTGSTSGLFDLELSLHVARLREEGCH